MNIDQLKKQAKNLRRAFPNLVAAHGDKLTLAQAQSAIAFINGYSSWEQMRRKCAGPTVPTTARSSSIESIIRNGLYFAVDEEPSRLPIAYSEAAGEPTRYEWAHNAILLLKREQDEALVRHEDDDLYEFMDRVRGNSLDGGFTSIAPRVLEEFERRIRASLDRAPLNVEGVQHARRCAAGARPLRVSL